MTDRNRHPVAGPFDNVGRAPVVVGERDLGREERAVALVPDRGAQRVLGRDAAEEPRALAPGVPPVVSLTLGAVQVATRDEFTRRTVAPPLVDDREAVWSHRCKNAMLGLERHLEQVPVAFEA